MFSFDPWWYKLSKWICLDMQTRSIACSKIYHKHGLNCMQEILESSFMLTWMSSSCFYSANKQLRELWHSRTLIYCPFKFSRCRNNSLQGSQEIRAKQLWAYEIVNSVQGPYWRLFYKRYIGTISISQSSKVSASRSRRPCSSSIKLSSISTEPSFWLISSSSSSKGIKPGGVSNPPLGPGIWGIEGPCCEIPPLPFLPPFPPELCARLNLCMLALMSKALVVLRYSSPALNNINLIW